MGWYEDTINKEREIFQKETNLTCDYLLGDITGDEYVLEMDKLRPQHPWKETDSNEY